jgi:glycosyltransferase involved in cell wall biosynthesis
MLTKFLPLLPFSPLEHYLLSLKIDLVYFVTPTTLAYDLSCLNYIYTVWDLSHRDDVEFPEIRSFSEFQSREFKFCNVLPRATAVIVDSRIGKDNVVCRYNIDEDRVHVIPFQPSIFSSKNLDNVDVCSKYSINSPYIFYPAQLWAHKNHAYIIEALSILRHTYDVEISAVFAGGNKGNLNFLTSLVKSYGLTDSVHFLGFVPNEDLASLYINSLALVMPTFFGPTNLPPLEAFALNIPVLYSKLPSLIEQVGDAALLFDLNNPLSLADKIHHLILDSKLRDVLVTKGTSQLRNIESVDRLSILDSIISSFSIRRKTWY